MTVSGVKVDIYKLFVGLAVTLILIISSFVFSTSLSNRARVECVEKDMVEVKAQAGFSSKNYEILRLEVMDELKDINTSIRELEKKVVLLNNKTSKP